MKDPIPWPRSGRCWRRAGRAARELYREVFRVLDELATAGSGGARQRLEQRWVATLAGRIRLWRYRVRAGGSFHPAATSESPRLSVLWSDIGR